MADKTSDPLGLRDMLNDHWLAAIGDVINAQKDAAIYLAPDRDSATIPARELTFTSLNQLPPKEINVVIFGQDPYPRAESAVGVAFNDGAIHKWTDKFSPSFANIIKNLLVGAGHLKVDQGVADVRKWLAANKIAPPPAWFEHTIKNGVCWLNTSLTFTSTDTNILAQHVKFWNPIIEAVIGALIDSKRDLITSKENPSAGLVFVLWGGHAQKLRKMVEKLNNSKSPKIDLKFIESPHPAATGPAFHTVHSFESINKALESMKEKTIDWFPKSSASDSANEEPASKPKTTKSAAKSSGAKSSSAKATASKKRSRSDDDDEDEAAPATKKRKAN